MSIGKDCDCTSEAVKDALKVDNTNCDRDACSSCHGCCLFFFTSELLSLPWRGLARRSSPPIALKPSGAMPLRSMTPEGFAQNSVWAGVFTDKGPS